jgi:hypothetical protein
MALKQTKTRQTMSVLAAFRQNDDENEMAARHAIAEALAELRQMEPRITPTIKALVALRGGEMQGLDFRFKTATSLFRKLMSRLDTSIAAAAADHKPTTGGPAEAANATSSSSTSTSDHSPAPPPLQTPKEVLQSIMDMLRYTAVFDTKSYTESVRSILSDLADHGFQSLRVKNFWGPGDGYQGINAVFVSPPSEGSKAFELQFHTPESLAVKEEECHSSYEKFRTAGGSANKILQYWEEMVALWDKVPVPQGWETIPRVVKQTLEFDLSKLSNDEKAAIKHRKELEKVCRYPVEELHSRAMKAEAEVAALMVWLMCKHGPGGVCEQKEKRSTCRAQLSILRLLVDTFIQDEEKAEAAGKTVEPSAFPSVKADFGEEAAGGSAGDHPPLPCTTSTSENKRRRRASTMNEESMQSVGVTVRVEDRSVSGEPGIVGSLSKASLSIWLHEA